jgi:hypothetical protein
MKTIQAVSGISLLYFLAQMALDVTQEGKSEAFMAVLMFLVIFLMASHLIGIQNNDIADEIKKNEGGDINNDSRNNNNNSLFKSSLDEIFGKRN